MVNKLNQQSKNDKKIEVILESIRDGYENLEKVESELEAIRKDRDTILKSNN